MGIKFIISYLVTAAMGANGKETVAGGAVAAVGTFATATLGGWDQALQVLLVLMLADYATGILGAFKTKTVNSEVMFWGGIRKAVVLFVVALAAMCDSWISPDAPIFRTAALYFYAGREGLSVIENFGILGVPLPAKLTQFLQQLQDKGEGGGTNG